MGKISKMSPKFIVASRKITGKGAGEWNNKGAVLKAKIWREQGKVGTALGREGRMENGAMGHQVEHLYQWDLPDA